MIEAYVIGVTLDLDDAITGKLEGVYQQTEQVADSVDSINTALASTSTLVGEAASSLHALTTAFAQAAQAAQGLQNAAGGIGAESTPPAFTGSPGAPGVPPAPTLFPGESPYVIPGHQTDGLGAPSSNMPAIIPGQGAQGQERWSHVPITGYGESAPAAGGGGGSGGAPPNWTFPESTPDEPFNRPGPVPLMPGRQPGGDGGGMHLGLSDLFFGQAVLDVGGHIVAQGYGSIAGPDQLVTEMELKNKAFTPADGDKVISAAKRIVNQVPGMSLIGALSLIQNGYAQTHDVDISIAMAEPLAVDALRLHNSGRDDAINGIWNLQRAADLAGTLNTKNPDGSPNITPFMNWIDNATQILQADQSVSTTDIWQATQQNDLGAMSASTQGQGEQDIVAGLLGGYKSGTGAAALKREMIGGKMSTGTEHILAELGLIDPAGATKTGAYYTLKPDALKEEDLFQRNPVEWFQQVFQPAVDRLSPNDRNALFHDLIAGTGTASGARSAAVDVMQDALIARMLYFAEHDEPSKAQSMQIIARNPATVWDFAGNELSVLENSAITGATSPVTRIARGVGNEAGDVSSALDDLRHGHPLSALGDMGSALKVNFDGIRDLFNAPAAAGEDWAKGLEGMLKDEIASVLRKILDVLMGQPGKTPSTAIYTRPIPGAPSTLQPTSPTIPGSNLSPPRPGRIVTTP